MRDFGCLSWSETLLLQTPAHNRCIDKTGHITFPTPIYLPCNLYNLTQPNLSLLTVIYLPHRTLISYRLICCWLRYMRLWYRSYAEQLAQNTCNKLFCCTWSVAAKCAVVTIFSVGKTVRSGRGWDNSGKDLFLFFFVGCQWFTFSFSPWLMYSLCCVSLFPFFSPDPCSVFTEILWKTK